MAMTSFFFGIFETLDDASPIQTKQSVVASQEQCRAHGGVSDMKRLPDICPAKGALIVLAFFTVLICADGEFAHANPYLAKPGEPLVKVRVGTCAVTGGFIHLYAALHNRIFDKYGINTEHVVLRGGVVAMAALGSDEIQFLYCNADTNIVRIATGADGKLVASPLVGLPYVVLARKT